MTGLAALWRLIRPALGFVWDWRFPLAVFAALHFHSHLIAVHREFDAFRADVKAAAPKAAAAQATVNHRPAAISQAIAETSDAQAPAYYRSVHAAAAAHRLRPAAVCRGPGGADLPGTDPAPQSVHGPDAAADLVCRPRAEDDQLVAAAGRAAEMRAIAQGWIATGIAKAD